MDSDSRKLDLVFGAIADPTRRAIIARLATGDATVGELAKPFDISMPAISRHLRVLEEAELIFRVRDGQYRRVRINPAAFKLGAEWFGDYRKFWMQSLGKLARHLDETAKGNGKGKAR